MSDSLRFKVGERVGEVSALLHVPRRPRLLYLLAHGAGAGMRHPFLETFTEAVAARAIATFRYQFPYMEAGRRRPDPPPVLHATVRNALAAASDACSDLPVIAGGKSMGGRMTSQAAARGLLPGLRGLAFLGFPLHPPGKVDSTRGDHLREVPLPLLFLQGTRDSLARLDLIRPLCEELRATLHVVEGGDHSFKVLKRSGRTQDEVMDELADALFHWSEGLGR